jgi:hypothetical protein
MSRSVILALHGHLSEAWSLSPGAVSFVAAGAYFAAGLSILAALRAVASPLAEPWRDWFRRGSVVVFLLSVAIWMGGWGAAMRSDAGDARGSKQLIELAFK